MAGLGIINKDKTEMTAEGLKKMFPSKSRTITEETVAIINAANSDPEFNGDEFINNMVTYKNVMERNQASMKEYIRALKFCAYLESENDSYTEAYIKARGDEEFVKSRRNLPSESIGYKELTNQASRYRKSKLVIDILTQSDVPLYLMFQGARYRAVSVLANEMETAPFSKDRISAAKALLESVKAPENVQIEMAIGPNQEARDLSSKLSEQLAASVAMQRKMLEAGVSLQDATKTNINLNNDVIDAEIDNG